MAQNLKVAQRATFVFVYFIKIKFELNIKSFCSEDWYMRVKQEINTVLMILFKDVLSLEGPCRGEGRLRQDASNDESF